MNTHVASKPQKPWDKPNLMARKCRYCGSQRPGMQPLRMWRDGKMERGYWHIECFDKDRKTQKGQPRDDRNF